MDTAPRVFVAIVGEAIRRSECVDAGQREMVIPMGNDLSMDGTFQCAQCGQLEHIVLRNKLGLCLDCLIPRCGVCETRHSRKVTCEEQRIYNRARRKKRPEDVGVIEQSYIAKRADSRKRQR